MQSPPMTPYANLSGDSGVVGYHITADSITVFFRHDAYVYDHARPGSEFVERMKMLAVTGRGLSTFIAQHVRDRYARKFPWS